MSDHPFSAPQPILDNVEKGVPTFYVVSLSKFCLMTIFTLGLYLYYWWYKNWKLYQRATEGMIWPPLWALMGAVLSYPLFQRIDKHLKLSGSKHVWHPRLRAIALIVLIIVGVFQSLLIDGAAGSLIQILLVCLNFYLIIGVQRAINHSENDPQGSSNNKLSGLNVFWILLGLVFWVLFVVLLVFMVTGIVLI